jgi:hypothetical protein
VPTDAYKYTIGVLLKDSCHLAFPQLQDMQNPIILIVKERNKKIRDMMSSQSSHYVPPHKGQSPSATSSLTAMTSAVPLV